MQAPGSGLVDDLGSRLTTLIWASAMGTYLLVAIGGITRLLDGGSACPSWPACGDPIAGTVGDTAGLVALGHRSAVVLVGVLLVATLVVSWHQRSRWVFGTLLVAVLLYPIQVAVGALTATRGGPVLRVVHLVVGIGIFGLTILALYWHLHRDSTPPTAPLDLDTEPTGDESHPRSSTDRNATMVATRADASTGLRNRARAYLALTKPRLMWLLCLVAVAAMALAAGPDLSVRTTLATVLGGVLAVGASGTFNNVLERDRDRRMERTADRPLAREQITVQRAAAFGVTLAVFAIGVFVVFVNWLAALLGLAAILFYSVVYTVVLKPNTDQNIVLGGAVGAFPALIGWAAVENTIGVPALVLGAVIFLWTPAHFYNLALAYRADYAEAGFPMLPVVRGEATTHRHILLYLAATLVAALALGATTRLDWMYALTAVLMGAAFLWMAIRSCREATDAAAFRAFHASNAYLGALLVAIFLDSLLA